MTGARPYWRLPASLHRTSARHHKHAKALPGSNRREEPGGGCGAGGESCEADSQLHQEVVRALDCILWIESKLDSRDYDALNQLPGLAQENLPIYRPKPVRVTDGTNPTVIKHNLKFLIQKKGVYHSDIPPPPE